jgi:hypothetical protein
LKKEQCSLLFFSGRALAHCQKLSPAAFTAAAGLATTTTTTTHSALHTIFLELDEGEILVLECEVCVTVKGPKKGIDFWMKIPL